MRAVKEADLDPDPDPAIDLSSAESQHFVTVLIFQWTEWQWILLKNHCSSPDPSLGPDTLDDTLRKAFLAGLW